MAAAVGAFEAALKQLSRRARTVSEVRRHLRERGFGAKEIAGAVERLTRLGYLDDRVYAVRYAGWAAEERPMGRRRVAAELMRRGVARDTIDQALEEALGPEREAAALERALAKAARGSPAPPDEAARRRVASALLRRGFRPAQVMAAVRAWASAAGETGTEEFEE